MKKIIDYTVVTPTDQYGNLSLHIITILMQEGWQPLGGLCAYNSSIGNNNLYQVMVKYEDS